MDFPDDENGDVFRRMEAGGVDFTLEHIVNFHAVFATNADADRIALMYVADWKAGESFTNVETVPHDEGGMELTLSKRMLLDHAAVTSFEAKFGERVALVDGYLDGWGVMQE